MAKKSKGLTVKTFRGLNRKKFEKRTSANTGKRLILDKGKPAPIQFLEPPDEMTEFERHIFQEDGRWNFVPCAGERCPLCEDEDESRSGTAYAFLTNVVNLKTKKVQILEGGKDIAGRIYYRYERNPGKFLKRTFEVTAFDTKPASFDVSVGEDDPIKTAGMVGHDLEQYLAEEQKRYYGSDLDAAMSGGDDDLEDEGLDDDEPKFKKDKKAKADKPKDKKGKADKVVAAGGKPSAKKSKKG